MRAGTGWPALMAFFAVLGLVHDSVIVHADRYVDMVVDTLCMADNYL